ncbi:MAG: MBL fold metallo-hydrolase [Faecalibacterium sp.]
MQETLHILGTGNATVTKCYNTCFALQQGEEYFLVDTGGGNGILAQLKKANIPMEQIHEIFLSHEHTDHLLGLIWLIRMIATKMKKGLYTGDLQIYCHANLKQTILTIAKLTVQDKFYNMIGQRIHLVTVADGETRTVMGQATTFFDIGSTKAEQYGFLRILPESKRFAFLGDEPYRDCEEQYAKGADWMLHEAFCLYADREKYQPYEKHHVTVKEACEHAETLGAKNLILYHTEDKTIVTRKAAYTAEGTPYFSGNLFVPDDLDIMRL